MIEIIDDFGDLWRLHYACHGCPPVHFSDTIYGVVIESGEPPEFTGDMGTVNSKHKVDDLNLVWCVTEYDVPLKERIRQKLRLKKSRATFEEGIRFKKWLRHKFKLNATYTWEKV